MKFSMAGAEKGDILLNTGDYFI